MYQEFKLTILELTGLSRDAIHIYVGLTVFFVFVALFSRGKMKPAALIPVLLVALTMEALDLYDNYRSMGAMLWGNSIHDLVNTVFWPSMIVVLAKLNFAFGPGSQSKF